MSGSGQEKGQPVLMRQFMGTHQNRLDSKGRVSVPAQFRTLLRLMGGEAESGGATMVLRTSHQYPCIEGWPPAGFAALAGPVQQRYDIFSQDQDDIETTIFSSACPVETDKEGRIVVPQYLLTHANISGPLTFIGLGSRFQIWEPAAGEVRLAEAAQTSRTRGLTLGAAARVPAPAAPAPSSSPA